MSYVAKGRNVIHNGNFNVWQRGTSFAAAISAQYLADRWRYVFSNDSIVTIALDTGVPTVASQYSLKVSCTTADETIGAAQYSLLRHAFELSDWTDMLYGKPWVLSFWVKAYQTGTFCVAFREMYGGTASYVAEYTINNSATWEKKTIQIPSPTIGTWNAGGVANAGVMSFEFMLSMGSNFQTTPNVWVASDKYCTANQTNFMSSTDNYIQFSQVQLEAGTAATEFDAIPYADELARCQRYLVASGGTDLYERHGYGYCPDTTHARIGVSLPVQMRAIPAIAYTTVGNFSIYTTGSSGAACTALGMERCSDKTASLIVTVASGATALQGTVLISGGQVTDKLFFTAEI